MIHKEIGVKSRVKVVISLLASQFKSSSQIDSAIRAIDYAGKKCLRLRNDITGSGVIMGNVMVLDLYIPLTSSNSHDVTLRYDEFNREVVKNLMNGVYHVGDGKTYGNFGRLNVGYVDPTGKRTITKTIKVETEAADWQVRDALRNVGEVIEIN